MVTAQSKDGPAKPEKERKWKIEDGDEFVGHRIVDGKRYRVIKKAQKQLVTLTKEEVVEIEAAFNLFDKDGSSGIDATELKEAMNALGLKRTKKEIAEIMEREDKDGSGSIEMKEFKSLMASMIKERPIKAELQKAFKMYDDDDGGTIDFENLKRVAIEMATELKEEPIRDNEIMCMIKMADRKNGGKLVDLDDFMYVMDQAGLFEDK